MVDIPHWYDLAVHYHQSSNLSQAEALYQQILQADPGHANVLNNLGVLRYGQQRLDEAGAFYRQALASNPNHVDAQSNLGVVLKDQGKLGEAIFCYRQALRINPNYADAHNNLGVALRENGQVSEAIGCYHQALALNPNHANALNNLGIAYQDQGRLAEACTCHRQALVINPNNAEALNSLGYALYGQGETDEAMACYRQALRLNPHHAEAHNNLGIALFGQGQLAEAEECYRQTLRCDPGHKIALWNRSVLRLQQGDFAAAWPDYEHRWVRPGLVPRSFQQPRWDGSPFLGKTILVHAEQGLGDALQFMRYLPMVQHRGGKVVYECHPALYKLLGGLAGVDQLICVGGALPPFDVHIPLVSLPGLFGTTLDNIPAQVPYVHVHPALVEHWRLEIARITTVAVGSPLNIGIAWQGNPKNTKDRYRSLPLTHFEVLAKVEGVRLVSLQVGAGTEQLAASPFPVIDLGSRFDPNSLEDLAAALVNLDMVVTVDSAVAHLAGALGVKALVLLPFVAEWRWLLERSDCPWYPTLRLYRQNKAGDWGEVMARVARSFSPGSKNRGVAQP